MKNLQSPPKLAINKTLYFDRGQSIPPHIKLEQRIVWNLLLHLKKSGFKKLTVYDGEEIIKVDCAKSAMELVFGVDESRIFFPGGNWVFFVSGNGIDVISDYSDDKGAFAASMEKFNPENYA